MTKEFSWAYRKLVVWTLIAEVAFWAASAIVYFLFFASGDTELQFLHPHLFWLFLSIPAILFVYLRRWRWKSSLYESYRGMGKTRMLWVTFHPLRYFLQYFFLRNILFFLILALAQPIMGNRKVKGSKRVLDLVICLDISSSMNTMDMEDDSRLTVAKRGISQLLNNLKGERISVVVFANDAYTQLPLTMDYGAAKMFVNEIETDMISDQGTNIGAALRVAQTQFIDSESGHAILVITDGEDHEQLWREQVDQLVKKNVELSYFGIGTEQGGLIPIDPQDPSMGYKRDGGSTIVSRLDANGLKRMAETSNSSVYFANSAYPDMISVVNELSSVKTKTVKSMEFTVQRNYYQIPLSIAFCCFMAYLFVPFLVNRSRS